MSEGDQLPEVLRDMVVTIPAELFERLIAPYTPERQAQFRREAEHNTPEYHRFMQTVRAEREKKLRSRIRQAEIFMEDFKDQEMWHLVGTNALIKCRILRRRGPDLYVEWTGRLQDLEGQALGPSSQMGWRNYVNVDSLRPLGFCEKEAKCFPRHPDNHAYLPGRGIGRRQKKPIDSSQLDPEKEP